MLEYKYTVPTTLPYPVGKPAPTDRHVHVHVGTCMPSLASASCGLHVIHVLGNDESNGCYTFPTKLATSFDTRHSAC